MKNGKYDEIFKAYDDKFSHTDWEKVEQYFADNPEQVYAGSKNGLMYSYTKFDGEIIRRSKHIGAGGFGCTKQGEKKQTDCLASALKRQTKIIYTETEYSTANKEARAHQLLAESRASLGGPTSESDRLIINDSIRRLEYLIENKKWDDVITEFVWLPTIKTEAQINQDLGVATSGLLIRRDERGDIYKVYQNMRYLGSPITGILKDTAASDDDRLLFSIDLLIKVSDLHTGSASISNKPYAHLDIKPGNVLMDAQGTLQLIDFGFTKTANLNVAHSEDLGGTKAYLPLDFTPSPHNNVDELKRYNACKPAERPSYFFDDKIATLRTIYHGWPFISENILSHEGFKQLPPFISAYLDTSNISKCIANDTKHTLKFIASVLILYNDERSSCTDELCTTLMEDTAKQDTIIQEYRDAKLKLNGATKEKMVTLLLKNELSIKYLPTGFKTDPDIIRAATWRDTLKDPTQTSAHTEIIQYLISAPDADETLWKEMMTICPSGEATEQLLLNPHLSQSLLEFILQTGRLSPLQVITIVSGMPEPTASFIDIMNKYLEDEAILLAVIDKANTINALLDPLFYSILFKNPNCSKKIIFDAYFDKLNKTVDDPSFDQALASIINDIPKDDPSIERLKSIDASLPIGAECSKALLTYQAPQTIKNDTTNPVQAVETVITLKPQSSSESTVSDTAKKSSSTFWLDAMVACVSGIVIIAGTLLIIAAFKDISQVPAIANVAGQILNLIHLTPVISGTTGAAAMLASTVGIGFFSLATHPTEEKNKTYAKPQRPSS